MKMGDLLNEQQDAHFLNSSCHLSIARDGH